MTAADALTWPEAFQNVCMAAITLAAIYFIFLRE